MVRSPYRYWPWLRRISRALARRSAGLIAFAIITAGVAAPSCTATLSGNDGDGGVHDARKAQDDVRGAVDQSLLPDQGSFVLAPGKKVGFSQDMSAFLNPERGFYMPVDPIEPDSTTPSFKALRSAGYTLAYAYAHIGTYRSSSIASSYLNKLDAVFDAVRQARIKIIIRFAYDITGDDSDASKARILAHIDQLEPTLKKHADVIYVLQAGFIGHWGEWHSSDHGLDNNPARQEIIYKLLSVLPADRMVQNGNTFTYKQDIEGANNLPAAAAFDGSNRARWGFHSDCFGASADDRGFYTSGSKRASERAWVGAETRAVPMGGETCRTSSFSTCSSMVPEMEEMHWSYLNIEYHPDVISQLKSGGCFDEINRRLGHRLRLVEATFPERAQSGGRFDLKLRVANDGFAPLYNPRPVVVVLEGPSGRHEATLDDVDTRRWAPNAETSVAARLQLPATLAEGSYRLSLWLPDGYQSLRHHPEYAIRLANQNTWDSAKGDNTLGTLTISASAPGDADSDAQTFKALK